MTVPYFTDVHAESQGFLCHSPACPALGGPPVLGLERGPLGHTVCLLEACCSSPDEGQSLHLPHPTMASSFDSRAPADRSGLPGRPSAFLSWHWLSTRARAPGHTGPAQDTGPEPHLCAYLSKGPLALGMRAHHFPRLKKPFPASPFPNKMLGGGAPSPPAIQTPRGIARDPAPFVVDMVAQDSPALPDETPRQAQAGRLLRASPGKCTCGLAAEWPPWAQAVCPMRGLGCGEAGVPPPLLQPPAPRCRLRSSLEAAFLSLASAEFEAHRRVPGRERLLVHYGASMVLYFCVYYFFKLKYT